jgi:N-methylhydantoinase A
VPIRVGVDTGGTFTDLVLYDSARGTLRIAKQPSTAEDASAAVLYALDDTSVDGRAIDGVVVGTTVGTNAVLERSGARVAFVTTAGFEDVVFIKRTDKEKLYDVHWKKPSPLVERADCVGVDERVAHDGEVIVSLDPLDCGALLEAIRARPGIEAIAICLLFSYVNPSHEQALRSALAAEFPDLAVTLSSDVSPMWREYERASTTIADAYVKPVLRQYVDAMERGLASRGVRRSWHLLKSNGGYMTSGLARERPISLILSGLAGGVIGAKHFAGETHERDLFTLDMGGTSCDIGLILEGQQSYANEFDVAWGIPISLPCVAVSTIGAGGGSIAWLDKGGFLHVGPQSAGASPGPAAYGAGGRLPTITDANLILGRLDPTYFLGGRMRLDLDRAREAFGSLARALEAEVATVAHAALETADENMANAIRLISVERGYDPRDFALLAFGGAGPLHGRAVASKLGIGRLLIPPHPGLCSAFGALIADWRVDRVWTAFSRSDMLDPARVLSEFARLEREAESELRSDGYAGPIRLTRSIDMRYAGQNYEREVPLPASRLDEKHIVEALGRFADLHRAFYGFEFEGEVIELINFRLTAVGQMEPPRLARVAEAAGAPPAWATRDVHVGSGGFGPCPIYRRDQLGAGVRLSGPAIVEEEDSTTLIYGGDTLTVLPSGVMSVQIAGGAA